MLAQGADSDRAVWCAKSLYEYVFIFYNYLVWQIETFYLVGDLLHAVLITM